jgi:hypothetical protein
MQVFECSCGNMAISNPISVRSGNTLSCGCLYRETRTGNQTHGCTGTPEYKAWKSMNARCYKVKAKNWDDYGGRGIAVCPRWREPNGQGFMNFLADVGPKPQSHERLTLDRKNNDSNYEPGNVRWATDVQQANNTRRSRRFPAFGKNLTAKEWSAETGIGVSLIKHRMRIMEPEIALTTPVKRKTPRR